ncbi:sphingoid base-phosphate phosphatase [Thermoascus aurantiacus ATCC 26904]
MDKEENGRPDAGLRSLNHYQNRLPAWRYWPRQKLLPLIRYETPYLAWLQDKIRTPSLDSYFAFTANLGTHTFFIVCLPILFWCGHTSLGRGIIHILACGVFFSGFLKDLLCLPRPLSPPLQRITMSGSAALEYGFPSTHSTNAVSVAVYCLSLLNSPDTTVSTVKNIILQVLLYIYAFSIVFGRLYCGMHGFVDVIVGSCLGAFIAFLRYSYGEMYDQWILSATVKEVAIVVLIILFLVRIHPEPADDCPCFDDSVAFAGVMLGSETAYWHYAQTSFSWTEPTPATIPYRLESIGWLKTILRIVVGVLAIFAWREVMKPSLLRILPPIFRVLEKVGLILPRRFFTKASEYKKIPGHLKDDDVLPNVSEIPSILTSIRHPRRRAVSVGPQSEADAYEALAYREKRRRESVSSDRRRSPSSNRVSPAAETIQKAQSKLAEYEHMMGTGTPRYSPEATSAGDSSSGLAPSPPAGPDYGPEGPDEEDMFSRITKPRVRYDVEVVTKLIVYSGISWLVMEGSPLLFEFLGLGVRDVE